MRSFLQELFRGRLAWDAISPYPYPGQADREAVGQLTGAFRRFAARAIHPDRIEACGELGEGLRQELADAGFFGVTIPREHGGGGASMTTYCRLVEEISAVDGSVATAIGSHLGLAARVLLLAGTDAQKAEWLPRMAAGEVIGSFALSEAEAGSDVRSLRTTAQPSGGDFILRGEKAWVTNGSFAGLFVVFARIPEADGGKRAITAFLVPAGAPGLSVGKPERKMGLVASSEVPLRLEGVRVPASSVLGERGEGFGLALRVLGYSRTALGAACIGASWKILEEAVHHTKERAAFHRKLIDIEMVREKLARVAANLYMMESITYYAAHLLDAGEADPSLETAATKILCTEAGWWNLHECQQVVGGIGLSKDYPYERHLRDARVYMILDGANEVLRSHLAITGLRAFAREGQVLDEASYLRALEGGAVHPLLGEDADDLEWMVYKFAKPIPSVIAEHGEDLPEREYIQERVADAAMWIYAYAATLSRTDAIAEARGEDASRRERDLCRAVLDACWDAHDRAVATLFHPRDADARADSIVGRLRQEGGYRAGLFENASD